MVDPKDPLAEPQESLSLEFKGWLDLNNNKHKANLAKAVLALHNHGGGRVVLGYTKDGLGKLSPSNEQVPQKPRIQYSQDHINGTLNKYCDPPFHISVTYKQSQDGGVEHPILEIPGAVGFPAVSKKASPDGLKDLLPNRIYIRRPGPKSEEPQTSQEWRDLIDRLCRNKFTQSGPDLPEPSADPARPLSVGERMSDKSPSPSRAAIEAAQEALDPEESLVLNGEISAEKVNEFRLEIESEMQLYGIYRIFKAANALLVSQQYYKNLRFGSKDLMYKGPFVAGSNWAFPLPGTYSQAHTQFLLNHWLELLEARDFVDDELTTATEIVDFAKMAMTEIRKAGGKPDLIFLTIPPSEFMKLQLYSLLNEHSPATIRGEDVNNAIWGAKGSINGLPVFMNLGADRTPAIFVIDVSDFEYEIASPSPSVQNDVLVDVSPIDEQRAIEMLTARPQLVKELYRSNNQDEGEYTRPEAIVRIQLLVHLSVICAGAIRERHTPRTRAARIYLGE